MKQFTPNHTQRADIAVEMKKLTKDSYGNAAVCFLVSGAILAALIFVPDIPIFVWIIMLFFVAIGIYGSFGAVIHRRKSVESGFSNYTYYLCKVVDKRTETVRYNSKQNRTAYCLVVNLDNGATGAEKLLSSEYCFYNSISVGEEFIVAEHKTATYMFKNTNGFIKL
jgi:hypothetical protein